MNEVFASSADRSAPQSRYAMLQLQRQHFQQLLNHAWNRSEFYRDYYSSHGIEERHLADISISDLPLLPKKTLIDNFDQAVVDPRLKRAKLEEWFESHRSPGETYCEGLVVIHGSGTTGDLGIFAYDQRACAIADATMAARLPLPENYPKGKTKVAFYVAAHGHFATVSWARFLPNAVYDTLILSLLDSPEQTVKQLNAFQPHRLSGYSSAVANLAELALEGQLQIRPRSVFVSGDKLTEGMKTRIREAWRAPIYDFYGASESKYIAIRTPEQDQMMVMDDLNIVEVLDEKDRAVPAEQEGRVVLTNLYNYTFPILRYELGDYVVRGTEQSDSRFTTLREISGRLNDALPVTLADGRRDSIHPIVLTTFHVPTVEKFQLVSASPERLRIDYVASRNIDAAVQREFQRMLDMKGAGRTTVEARRVPAIANDPKTGKLRLVTFAEQEAQQLPPAAHGDVLEIARHHMHVESASSFAQYGRTEGPSHISADRNTDNVLKRSIALGQQQLWLLNRLFPLGPTYNMPKSLRLVGGLDVGALRDALNEVVRRHEALRTTFAMDYGEPVQVIAPRLELALVVEDLRGLPEVERHAEARRRVQAEAQAPFDLARGPLVRARLLQLGEKEHWLLVTLHHIVADGWSMGVLWREVSTLYGAYGRGTPSPLPALPMQYADYAVWQREWLQGAVLDEQLRYWKEALAGLPVLELPTDRPRPPVARYRGGRLAFELGTELTRALRVLSRQEGATLFMTLLAAFQVLLYRYSGQEDVAVGVPVAGRARPELEGLIGFFVNTLVLRGDLSGAPSFKEYVGRVRARAMEAYAHQDLPFEKLVELLVTQRDQSRNPLFQVMFTKWMPENQVLHLAGLEPADVVSVNTDTAKFDLDFTVIEKQGRCHVTIDYAVDLFDAATIERMAGHWRTLLEGIVADPRQRISHLPLLTSAERHQLLDEWNDTAADYPRDRCIHQLFDDQVERTPEAVAVVFEDRQLTYAELNARANQLAHHLRTLRVGPDVLVGLCLERSLELVIGLLGILKAGGAYVPLDPSYPQERLAFMLADARPMALVTQRRLLDLSPECGAQVVCLDQDWPKIATRSATNPNCTTTAENVAYVMYTSGSTGNPKGVVSVHVACVNRCHWMWKLFPFRSDDVCCQKTALSFVDSVWEIFGPLLQGVTSVIIPDDVVVDPVRLVEALAERSVTRIVLVPSLLRALLDTEIDLSSKVPALAIWICSGEACPADLLRRFHDRIPQRTMLNLYGSSEVAADATWYPAAPGHQGERVPIGRPIANTQMYVLDVNQKLVPIGVPGELYIGGDGLACGYWNRPELTAERFVRNPFSVQPGARLYRTGDRVRYLPDGNLEFLGRLDTQVKLRGFRIELGEIEAALARQPAVREAVVLLREDIPGDPRLVAYVVPQGENLVAADLRVALKQQLPDYMVPAAFVHLPALPLTPNGKIDRKALPAAQGRTETAVSSPPRNPVEEAVAGIWCELLHLHQVGIHDNFFDLGGHSLLAIQMLSWLRDVLGVEVSVGALFLRPTIAGLAEHVSTPLEGGEQDRVLPIRRRQRSFAQQR